MIYLCCLCSDLCLDRDSTSRPKHLIIDGAPLLTNYSISLECHVCFVVLVMVYLDHGTVHLGVVFVKFLGEIESFSGKEPHKS